MTDITSRSGGVPTAYTQLVGLGSSPQVDTGVTVIPGTSPHISNIRLALDTLLKAPENFLKGGSDE